MVTHHRSGTVATATVDITPERALPLSGYEARRGRSTSVRGRLEANVLAFFGPEGTATYLVSVDALYGGTLTSALRARVGLRPEQLVVLASHTHFAPGLDPDLKALGVTDPAFIELVADRVATAIASLRSDGHGSVSTVSIQATGLLMNRRRPSFGGGVPVPRVGRVVTAPHPKGPVDDLLRMVRVSAGGKLVALLWGLSCHPVCSPDPQGVSPCFPGAVRAELRRTLGDRVPVLFVQGFSADVRPESTTRRPPRGGGALLRYLAAGGTRFAAQDEAGYLRWCDHLARLAVRAENAARSAEASSTIGRMARVEADRPPGWARTAVLSRITVSSQLSILAANAEVPSERVAGLAGVGSGLVIPAGCCDEVIGYWPTDEMLREGGYEGVDAARHFPPLDWSAVGGPDELWTSLLTKVDALGKGGL